MGFGLRERRSEVRLNIVRYPVGFLGSGEMATSSGD